MKRLYSRQVHSFGSYMDKKYLMQNDQLKDADLSITAIRILLDKHVVY